MDKIQQAEKELNDLKARAFDLRQGLDELQAQSMTLQKAIQELMPEITKKSQELSQLRIDKT